MFEPSRRGREYVDGLAQESESWVLANDQTCAAKSDPERNRSTPAPRRVEFLASKALGLASLAEREEGDRGARSPREASQVRPDAFSAPAELEQVVDPFAGAALRYP